MFSPHPPELTAHGTTNVGARDAARRAPAAEIGDPPSAELRRRRRAPPRPPALRKQHASE